MFDVGFSELVLIALIALIVLGPKRLPEVARTTGRWVARLRRFAADVKQDFDRELHTAELSELRNLKQEMADTQRAFAESSQQTYRGVMQDVPATLNPVSAPAEPAAVDRELLDTARPSIPGAGPVIKKRARARRVTKR